jgi:hypothetical protein
MQDMAFESPEILRRWAAERDPSSFGLETTEDWWRDIETLLRARGSSAGELNKIEVTSRALSRGKMLWNYLRSSLPEIFMEPLLMRSAKLSDFVDGIERLSEAGGFSAGYLPLRHRPDLNWMYSGEGRGVK